jgi:hypothetical protein
VLFAPLGARYSGLPALHPFGAVCASLRRSNSLPANWSATRPPLLKLIF